MKINFNSQAGQIVIMSLVMLTVMLLFLGTLLTATTAQILSHRGAVNKEQAINIAEAGLEMAMWKLNNQGGYTGESNTVFGAGTYTIAVTTIDSGKKAVTINAYIPNSTSPVTRKTIKTTASVGTSAISFHYGAQVGVGGLTLNSNSTIDGNVFSNGNISGSGTITGSATIAGNGNSITGASVGGNVLAYSCLSSATVGGNLTYVTGGSHTCSVAGTTNSQSGAIASEALPILQTQIDEWKAETTSGTAKSAYIINSNQTVTENTSVVITGNMSVGSNATWNLLGTTKIIGNLSVNSNATVNLSGTLYVTGTVSFGSGSTIQLATVYGTQSGILLSDGTISINSNAVVQGSGQAGSYLLVLSTSTSNSAISISSNALGAILYASDGGVQINSNAALREVTGYRVSIGSNATITYETGLASEQFYSGPGGSWEFTPGSYVIFQ